MLVRGRGARGCWHLAVPVIPLSDTALPGRCPRRLPTPPRVVRRCLRSRCWRVCVAVWSARHSRVLSPRLRARCVDGYRFVGPGDELAQPSCRPPSQDVVDRPSVTGDPLSLARYFGGSPAVAVFIAVVTVTVYVRMIDLNVVRQYLVPSVTCPLARIRIARLRSPQKRTVVRNRP